MRYFEIEFGNEPRNQECLDGTTVGDYSICILGETSFRYLNKIKDS